MRGTQSRLNSLMPSSARVSPVEGELRRGGLIYEVQQRGILQYHRAAHLVRVYREVKVEVHAAYQRMMAKVIAARAKRELTGEMATAELEP